MPAFSPERLGETLGGPPAGTRYLVGFSGGLDSTVLLHALHALCLRRENTGLRALHVHHGLQLQADAWAAHCLEVCAALAVPCEVARVDARAAPGESPEAAARRARYDAFAARLTPGETLLLAHHADDQLETLLLRLARGAGSRGLAGMPAARSLAAGQLARPLLAWSREDLRAWATMRALSWIEDPSNATTRADRNHLRHAVVPALRARWPRVAERAAQSAAQLAEDARLLGELAAADLGAALGAAWLPREDLRALTPARQRNALRSALLARGLPLPSRARLEELLRQCREARIDRCASLAWPGAEVHVEGERVWLLPPLPAAPSTPQALLPGGRVSDACGELSLLPASAQAPAWFAEAELAAGLTVAYRRGGERLVTGSGRETSLSRLLQEARVPAWLRSRLPLVCSGGRVLAVAGLRAPASAPADSARGWGVAWTPATALRPGLESLDRGRSDVDL